MVNIRYKKSYPCQLQYIYSLEFIARLFLSKKETCLLLKYLIVMESKISSHESTAKHTPNKFLAGL